MLEPLLIQVSASTLDTVLSRAHPKDTLVDVLVVDLQGAELDSFLRKHGFIRATDVPWHGNVVYERPQAGRFLKTCFWRGIYPAVKKTAAPHPRQGQITGRIGEQMSWTLRQALQPL